MFKIILGFTQAEVPQGTDVSSDANRNVTLLGKILDSTTAIDEWYSLCKVLREALDESPGVPNGSLIHFVEPMPNVSSGVFLRLNLDLIIVEHGNGSHVSQKVNFSIDGKLLVNFDNRLFLLFTLLGDIGVNLTLFLHGLLFFLFYLWVSVDELLGGCFRGHS